MRSSSGSEAAGATAKGVKADRHAADARIVPTLGAIDVARLTTRQVRDWLTKLAAAPKLVRTRAGAAERAASVGYLRRP